MCRTNTDLRHKNTEFIIDVQNYYRFETQKHRWEKRNDCRCN